MVIFVPPDSNPLFRRCLSRRGYNSCTAPRHGVR
jgi:hypothetical protein